MKLAITICTLVTKAFLTLSIQSVQQHASTRQVRNYCFFSVRLVCSQVIFNRDFGLFKGVLFCVGGRGGSGDPFRSIECYSITKNSWFFGPEMNSRRRHVGVISVGGKDNRYKRKNTIQK